MKKTLRYLMALMLMCITVNTGAQSLLSYTMDDANWTSQKELAAGNGTIYFGADKRESSTVPACGYGYKGDGDMTSTSTKYALLTPSRALQVGDIITIKAFATSNTSGSDFGLALYAERTDGLSPVTTLYIPSGNKNKEVELTYTVTTGDGLVGLTSFYVFRAPGKSTYMSEFEITGGGSPDDPSITINPTSVNINATVKGEVVMQSLDITCANLTGSKLRAEITPAIKGMAVSLGDSIIVDGALATDATIIYSSDVNVPVGTTTLKLFDFGGNTMEEVTVNYSAHVEDYSMLTVSEETTWDFATLEGNVQFKDADKRTERLYANIDGITIPSSFSAQTLAFTGEYPIRNSQYAQNGSLRFNTTVPGTVQVFFSNTGSSNNNRWVQVNGIIGKVEADGTEVRNESFEVPAGNVVIDGYNPEEGGAKALRYMKVVFTPKTPEFKEPYNFNQYGYGTFYYDDYEFAIPEGVKAFVVTDVVNRVVQMEELLGTIPAKTAVLLTGNPSEGVLFPAYNPILQPVENMLHGNSQSVAIQVFNDEDNLYILSAKNGVVGFYFDPDSSTGDGHMTWCDPHRCYLCVPASKVSGANGLYFDLDDVPTGISTVAVDSVLDLNAPMYNLAGQRVDKSYKGVVIQNGKKVIKK